MFQPGKVYKVKLEPKPGELDFGRATIVERTGTQLSVMIKTAKDPNASFPKGTRIWFVNDSPDVTFNGLWASAIIGGLQLQGKNLMLCAAPRLEPLLQRRRTPRVSFDTKVRLFVDRKEIREVRSIDISRSGIALESSESVPESLEPGHEVGLIIETSVGEIALSARVIRVERIWLTRKTQMGLEYANPSSEANAKLDKLLTLLGAKPHVTEADPALDPGDRTRVAATSGLSSWMQNTQQESRGRFVGRSAGEQDAMDIVANDAQMEDIPEKD